MKTKEAELRQKFVSAFSEGMITFAKEAALSEDQLQKVATYVQEKLEEAAKQPTIK